MYGCKGSGRERAILEPNETIIEFFLVCIQKMFSFVNYISHFCKYETFANDNNIIFVVCEIESFPQLLFSSC